jgi:hypothetical protein
MLLENAQGLCAECHKLKTYHESLQIQEPCKFLSAFNMETWKLFVESEKPSHLQASLHPPLEEPMIHIDIIRCRTNGILQFQGEWPVFAPTDEIVKADGTLGDYNWVELECRSKLQALPYEGPGWYHKMTCQYLLSRGIHENGNISNTPSQL